MTRDRDLRLDVVAQWRHRTSVLLPIGKARPSESLFKKVVKLWE